jgi:heptosyltransferase III
MRFGAFGDMVLLTVLLRHLQARFGQQVDVISSGPWTQPLLEGQPSVGRLMLIGSRRTPYWASVPQRRLVKWLRERGAGPTWFCDLSSRGKQLLHRGGITDELICDSREFPWVPGESFADRYIRLGNFTPPGLEGRIPGPITGTVRAAEIDVSEAARESARAWLGGRGLAERSFIVVHAGSRHVARRWLRSRAGASKYWPEARWGVVVRALRDLQPDHAVLLSGTPAEYGFNEDIAREAAVSDLHNAADDLPIPMLLPVLEKAASMVSVDTGPAHAAAALGCPTVSLFGTANAELFRPGGATTRAIALTGTVDGRQNILGITPEAVISAWKSLVHPPGSSAPSDSQRASTG